MRIRPHWDTKGTRKTKVSEFQIITVIDEKILRLQITMKDPMRMAV